MFLSWKETDDKYNTEKAETFVAKLYKHPRMLIKWLTKKFPSFSQKKEREKKKKEYWPIVLTVKCRE